MTVCINGIKKYFSDNITLKNALTEVGSPLSNVVIEMNREILSLDDIDKISISDGDEIEVLRFVGGGDYIK